MTTALPHYRTTALPSGTLKSTKSTTFTQYMLQQYKKGFLFEGAEAPQAADTAAKGLGGAEIVKNDKIHKIHTPKLQDRVFSEGAEAPQAAATQTQRAGGP